MYSDDDLDGDFDDSIKW